MRNAIRKLGLGVSLLAIGVTASATPPGFGMGAKPVRTGEGPQAKTVQDWWPEVVDLSRLRDNAMSSDAGMTQAEYVAKFEQLDLDEVKADITAVLSDSKDWWPADYGTYAGLFIRLAWHSAGTYRSGDGRGGSDGGQIRFEPLNSWPDNGNLDKARRLLWPVKAKYGDALSWADLMILSGNVALESAGFKTFGFSGGRVDDLEPDLVYWGPESKYLTAQRFNEEGELADPLAATEMGLIYVNPQGPEGNPEILASAERIRTTFGRMGMNDEETAALIVGGHTLGKAHGARDAASCVGAEPAANGVEAQGLGWKNKCGSGVGPDATTSGLEGAWTATPAVWSNNYVQNLYAFEWTKTKSPSGAIQWVPENEDARFVPDAYDPNKFHQPVMFTTDLALRYDTNYGKVTKRFLEEPGAMDDAFARAWFKLTHRDLGPKSRYAGSEVPSEDLVWQDPLPSPEGKPVNARDIASLKKAIRAKGLDSADLVGTAWASASTFRDTDFRGGANGARIRFAPQRDWAANNAASLDTVIAALEAVQADFNKKSRSRKVSLADLIVLAGGVGIEDAAKAAGYDVTVPFTAGRVDATEAMTDPNSFAVLEPAADGFRNYYSKRARLSPSDMLIDRADTLTLTVPEMSVLVAGMRVIGTNAGDTSHGVFTDQPGTLSNDFFANLLDMSTAWTKSDDGVFVGTDRKSGDQRWTATEVDLVFGSNSELRSVAESYALNRSEERFVNDFIDAWVKVMNLDRFELN
ncbi:MAG: catalase/peroxidase HPI [Pseudomonadota bacterium]